MKQRERDAMKRDVAWIESQLQKRHPQSGIVLSKDTKIAPYDRPSWSVTFNSYEDQTSIALYYDAYEFEVCFSFEHTGRGYTGRNRDEVLEIIGEYF